MKHRITFETTGGQSSGRSAAPRDQEDDDKPIVKARDVATYLLTTLTALAFAVVFLWPGWSCLRAYVEWSHKDPPPTAHNTDD